VNVPDSLLPVVRSQRGIVHRHQLYSHGVTRSTLRAALGRRWTAVLPGVVALFTGGLDSDQRMWAAVLYAGEDAVLTGIEAARRHGLRDLPPPGVHAFLVPERRSARRAGFVVVKPTVRHDAAARVVHGVLTASPARAVVDAAEAISEPTDVLAVVLQVTQQRLATLATLRHELERAPTRGSAALRQAVIEAERGAWSRPEADCLALLRSSPVLPQPIPNARLADAHGQRLPSPDAWFPGVGLAVQVHSRRHHAEGEDFDNTVATDSMLTTAGAVVIGVTPRQLRLAPDDFLSRVEATHHRLKRSGVLCPIRVVAAVSA
jgi:hypothetical protein